MQICSEVKSDNKTAGKPPGSYEWWYFDAIDADKGYKIVIIFYEGNPFSLRYIKAMNEGGETAAPERFPAVSISIYKNEKPVYYSFTEYDAGQCFFSVTEPRLRVGPHQCDWKVEDGLLRYSLCLKEQLPSADALAGSLVFECIAATDSFINEGEKDTHCWNLVQPRAAVRGKLEFFSETGQPVEIAFNGMGYHDHNTGFVPMREDFSEWYWGRFHFEEATFVCYLINTEGTRQYRGWLIEKDSGRILQSFDQARKEDYSINLFGLSSARKLFIDNGQLSVTVQQSKVIDSGPFYQRFSSDALLIWRDKKEMASAGGITEYLCPGRIYNRLFWPLVKMRIRYEGNAPHWVQKSKKLYRWTW